MKGIINLVVAFTAVSLLPVSLIVSKHSTVEAQSSIGFTSPADFPLVELKQATPRQKRILSQMPESDYGDIEADAIRVAEVDLNNDGFAEYISTYVPTRIGQCGNAGCPTTIYSNQSGRWRAIYSVLGGSRTKIGNTVTNGFSDLVIPTGFRNGVHSVLSFTNTGYTFSYFQDGNNRFSGFSTSREVRVPKSTVFYSRPSKSSPVKLPYSIGVEPIVVVARTNDWYLILPCTSRACRGDYVYLPVEVVDGRRRTSNNQPQNVSFKTRRFAYDGDRNPVKNLSISYPSTNLFMVDGPSGGYEIWNRQPSRELQTSISGDYDRPRSVALPTGLSFTYFNAVSPVNSYQGVNDYISTVNDEIKSLQADGIQFRRENVRVNGMEGVRLYYDNAGATRLPYSLSCCGVITVLKPNQSGSGFIRARSHTNDLKSDLRIIFTIHNSIRRL